MLDRMKESTGSVLGFRFDGKLSESDCATVLIPELERAMSENRNVRILLKIEGFRSWRPGEGWEAFKQWPGLERVDRIAVVGGERWREWMNRLPGLFVGFDGVDVRYFPESRLRDAWGWLREGLVVTAPRAA
ncbi:universal stress protein UspA [Methanoculleus sediminis]|uniref:Universal stress protein UspA n=1 Tax=Methanoculleus sediminis TaxID=1550566 RepID=A0A0H1R0A6_9EURY|nr:STAS/SEC14 domain-containing protein [Methanoculleus sediminis]KLK88625.1 universal stress protein UspA [Methanoculleus sediminis]